MLIEKKFVLFIVTYTEKDKELHEKAILNLIFQIMKFKNIDIENYYYEKFSNPYRVSVTITVLNTDTKYKWSFLVVVPTHKKGITNPWELSEDWKNSLIIQMKSNLVLASTIRDKSSKYIIRGENEFYSIAALPFNSFGEEYFYPSVIEKASIIMYTIVKNHPFYDGNKRTALLTCMSFLNSCGFDLLKINKVEIVERVKDFMIYIADSTPKNKEKILKEIEQFILENIIVNIEYQMWMISNYSKNIMEFIDYID